MSAETFSVRALAAGHVTRLHRTQRLAEAGIPSTGPGIAFPPEDIPIASKATAASQTHQSDAPEYEPKPICIIGAGTAGLYAAMILKQLGISYEILEANNRIGGRLYTYRFGDEEKVRNAKVGETARYDYTDLGAMRFPSINFMDPVFKLFMKLGMYNPEKPEQNLLVEYKYKADNTFEFYNGRRLQDNKDLATQSKDPDPFHVSTANKGPLDPLEVAQGPDAILGRIFGYYANILQEPESQPEDPPKSQALQNEERGQRFTLFWKYLTRQDHHSMRSYLLNTVQLDEATVEWLETNSSGTGLYNLAFVEMVMDGIDFGEEAAHVIKKPPPITPRWITEAKEKVDPDRPWKEHPWWCIDGGADYLAQKMREDLGGEVHMRKRVVRMRTIGDSAVAVAYRDSATNELIEKEYSQVICTVPLGCLEAIEFPDLNDLSYTKRVAIRSLNYDTSTKVALKFKTRWWEDPKIMPNGRIIRGGVSTTDLPIRTVVYPSYGWNLKPGQDPVSGVILASYVWGQDAQRLGGLVHTNGTEADKLLVELVLDNLATLHGIDREQMGELVDHKAWNWHDDPYARGAFALFGPAQFGRVGHGESLFTSLRKPAGANSRIHIAGEATSVHHAWVLGALNSAWRAVNHAIELRPKKDQKALFKKFYDEWPIPQEEQLAHNLKVKKEES